MCLVVKWQADFSDVIEEDRVYTCYDSPRYRVGAKKDA